MIILSILWTILKICLSIIAVILGVILLLVLIILFVPLRYEAEVAKYEDLKVSAKISYFFRAVRVYVTYDKKGLGIKAKVLMFTLMDQGDSSSGDSKDNKKRKNRKNRKKKGATKKSPSSSDSKKPAKDVSEERPADKPHDKKQIRLLDEIQDKKEVEIQDKKEIEIQDKKEIEIQDKPDVIPRHAPVEKSEANLSLDPVQKSKIETNKVEPLKIPPNQRQSISSQNNNAIPDQGEKMAGEHGAKDLVDKAEVEKEDINGTPKSDTGKSTTKKTDTNTSEDKRTQVPEEESTFDKVKRLVGFLREERNIGVLRFVIRRLFKAIKSIFPRKIKGRVRFGFEDPSTTGYILGCVSMFYPKYYKSFAVQGVFDRQIVEGDIYVKGHLRVSHFVYAAIRIILDGRVRRLIKEARK